jgi:type IV secretory pathway VirB3-like protein
MINSRIYAGLVKSPLFLGGELKPILFNAMSGFAIILIFRNIPSIIVTVILIIAVHYLIGYINAREPRFFEIFNLFRKQDKFYPARSNLFVISGKKWRHK